MKTDKEYNWRKIFWAGVLVCVLVYAFGEPYFEKWFGVELPSIRDQGDGAVIPKKTERTPNGNQNRQANRTADRTGNRTQPDSRQSGSQRNPTSQNAEVDSNREDAARERASATQPSDRAKPYLNATGTKHRLQSPAGLIYGMGPSGQHRVDHVMSHSLDDPSRPVHSVFEGTEQEILQVIDEAYGLIQSKSNRVRSRPDDRLDFRVEHIVDMQRKIGYLGGQRGRRENHPARSKITLVLDNEKFVITAYPDQ